MRIAFAALFLLLPLISLAVPTGLNIMPTAESLGIAELRIDHETGGSGKLYVPIDASLSGTQVGAILGLEGGIDHVSTGDTVYNAKWVIKKEGLVLPALAIGAQGITSDEEPQYYVVASKSVVPKGVAKVHAGFLRDATSDDTILMLGASSKLGPLRIKADRVNGGVNDGQAVSVGLDAGSFAVTGTHYDFENRSNENTLTVSYFYGVL